MQTVHPSQRNPSRLILTLGMGLYVCLLGQFGCRHKERALSEGTRSVQGQGFALRYDPSVFQTCQVTTEPRLTVADIGTDIPFDNAPKRVKFTLRAKAPNYLKGSEVEPWGEGSLQVIPLRDASVKDFAQAYPDLQKEADGLRAILKGGALRVGADNVLPDWNCVDKEQTIHAKARILDMPWCSGIQFLTQYTQEPGTAIVNAGLVYKFQGLSKDGAYYVAAEIPAAHRSLPNHDPATDLPSKEKADAYYAETEHRLDGLEGTSFFPPLNVLREMIQSLHPQGQ